MGKTHNTEVRTQTNMESFHPKNAITGIKYNPKKWIASCFFWYATFWTLLKPVVDFLSPDIKGIWNFIVFLSIALISGTIYVWPKRKTTFTLPHSCTSISIEFNDMFSVDGCKVISVNEFFDSEIGDPVSPASLHGYFLQKVLGGHSMPMDDAVSNIPRECLIENITRTKGKTNRFKLGTSIEVIHSDTKYFLFALCKTDSNYKAYCTPSLMLEALDGLWKFVRHKHNGRDVVVPLIGSKLAGVGLAPPQLLDLIIISIIQATKSQELSTNIKIVLLPSLLEDIDLRKIKQQWR